MEIHPNEQDRFGNIVKTRYNPDDVDIQICVLCCAVLCCAVLCCVMLCCAGFSWEDQGLCVALLLYGPAACSREASREIPLLCVC